MDPIVLFGTRVPTPTDLSAELSLPRGSLRRLLSLKAVWKVHIGRAIGGAPPHLFSEIIPVKDGSI